MNQSQALDARAADWSDQITSLLGSEGAAPLQLVGVGNPIKKDDSVGIFIVSKLKKKFGARPSKSVRIHPPLAPELLFSKINLKTGSLIIFDAIEQNSSPGSIIFANIADTKFGYFATHNIPMKLIPAVSERVANIFVLGIQPQDIDIGEGLSETVLRSADEVVAKLGTRIEERFLNGIN